MTLESFIKFDTGINANSVTEIIKHTMNIAKKGKVFEKREI